MIQSSFAIETTFRSLAYLAYMINAEELRIGNAILQKVNNKIVMVKCGFEHFDLLSKGEKNLFPVVLKAEILEKAGFIENKDYPLYPQAREFKLVLPVIGNNKNEVLGYIKSSGECFASATVNGAIASNNVHHLHQLQNLVFVLTGKELELR